MLVEVLSCVTILVNAGLEDDHHDQHHLCHGSTDRSSVLLRCYRHRVCRRMGPLPHEVELLVNTVGVAVGALLAAITLTLDKGRPISA